MDRIDFNLLILLAVAAMNAYTAFLSRQTNKNVAIVEKATNSIKDDLVRSTAKASLAEGHAAGLEQGRKQGREEKREREKK